jgi:hypothetical protein
VTICRSVLSSNSEAIGKILYQVPGNAVFCRRAKALTAMRTSQEGAADKGTGGEEVSEVRLDCLPNKPILFPFYSLPFLAPGSRHKQGIGRAQQFFNSGNQSAGIPLVYHLTDSMLLGFHFD